MEILELTEIEITKDGQIEGLQFDSAQLVVSVDGFERSWYVDVSYLKNLDFLENMVKTMEIDVTMKMKTVQGISLTGAGFFHASLPVLCAAIKGNGELLGYVQ